MNEHRFDGRVAVVTGAGRGIGRAYARLLADRGATVVVNDIDPEPASSSIDTNDISTDAGARALVQAAMGSFGRIDVLINNAGIMRWAGPPEVDRQNLRQHLAVHVGGAFSTALAAWPHMVEQGYGRIVMTTSAGLFGLPTNTSYATAKGAVIGLTRSMAVAGAKHGIKVNAIAPAAYTRLAGPPDPDMEAKMPPEAVAPMAAYLAHEDCPVSGEIYAAGAGRFSRILIASTPGHLHTDGAPTIEDVAANWEAINDESGYEVPQNLMDWSATFTRHFNPTDGP